MYTAYHYTTEERARRILKEGLKPTAPAAYYTKIRAEKVGKGIWAFPGAGWYGNVDEELAEATKEYWQGEIASIHGVEPSELVLLAWEADPDNDDIVDDIDGPNDIAASLVFKNAIAPDRIKIIA